MAFNSLQPWLLYHSHTLEVSVKREDDNLERFPPTPPNTSSPAQPRSWWTTSLTTSRHCSTAWRKQAPA